MRYAPVSPVVRTTLAIVVSTMVLAAGLVLGGAPAQAAAQASTSVGALGVSSGKLGACKQRAVKKCRTVTARKCRTAKKKRARARGVRVSQRRLQRTCARVAKRHCKKRSQVRRINRVAATCARSSARRPSFRFRPSGVLPTAASTGVPSATRLKVVRGDIKVTTPGTVLSGLDVRGFVDVRASNVTIQNSIIRGRSIGTTGVGTLLSAYGDHTNLVIKDTTIRATYPSMYVDGLKGRNFTAYRVDISNVVDTVLIGGGNDTAVIDSWLHDNLHYATGVTGQSDGKTHDDNIQIEGGTGIRVENNRIEGSDNAALMVTQNAARTSDVTIADNYLAGGACTINMGEKGKGPIQRFSIRGNVFGMSKYHANRCPMRLPRTSSLAVLSNLWTNSSPVNPNWY